MHIHGGSLMQILKISALTLLCALAASAQNPAPQPQPPARALEQQKPLKEAVETEIVRAPLEETDKQAPGFSARHPRYILRAGDVLELTFTFTPELNQTVPVQPDGFISLKEVGDVHVAGKDLPQVRAAIAEAYAAVLQEPKINIELKEFEKPYFIAAGQVRTPGKYEMKGDTTVTEAVAVAGGFTDGAKHSQVLVFRRLDPERVEVKKIDAKQILSGKGREEDVFLRPGDMVYVPQNRLSKLKGIIIPRVTVGPSIY
jgi:polysaccharide biosynthesis/export protein